MIILQNILFPNEICKETELFYREGKTFDGAMLCEKGHVVSFDTYFNSFAYKKWKRHTRINEVCLKVRISGKCNVYKCCLGHGEGNEVIREGMIEPYYIKSTSESEEIDIRFDECGEDELLYFAIEAIDENAVLHNGYYYSEEDFAVHDVSIAVAICTYRREEYIERNINKLIAEIIDNPASPLYGRMEVYISDNGQSLSDYSNKKVHIYPNLNLGGSGGFTRCLIEIIKANPERGHTHVIMMDDDIDFFIESLNRTFAFLQLLQDDYRNAIVGGQMLMSNNKTVQFENAGRYGKDGFLILRNRNKDMTDCRNLINNMTNYIVNYNAWCYCCMPISKISYDNLPLPLFIHMDDIEYSLRNKFEVITINGICVWHPFYSNQRAESIVYYDVRNKLIVMSEMDSADIRKYALKWINSFHHYMYSYNYNRVILACKAVLDFCKGFDYFKDLDPIMLNKALMEYNTHSENVENDFRYNNEEIALKPYTSKFKFFLNYFLPSVVDEVTIQKNIIDAYPYRVKKIVAIDVQNNKRTTYERSFRKMAYAELLYRYTKHVINTKIYSSEEEWKSRLDELKNISFWSDYLKLEEIRE